VTEALQGVACAQLKELSFVPADAANADEPSAHTRLAPAHAGELNLDTWMSVFRPGPQFSVDQLAAIHVACPALLDIACDVYLRDEASLQALSQLRFTGLKMLGVQVHGGVHHNFGGGMNAEPAFGMEVALPLVGRMLSRNAVSELRLELRLIYQTAPPPAPSREVSTEFSRALAANTSLHMLQLDHATAEALGAAQLTDALTSNRTLKTLEVDAHLVGLDGDADAIVAAATTTLHAVGAALAANCALQSFKFVGTLAGLQAGLPFLGAALASNTHLMTLSLQGTHKDPHAYTVNDRIDSAALQPLAAALASSNRTLRFLGVRACRINDDAARILAGALTATNNAAHGLTALLLDRNCIGPEGASALAQSLFGNNTLTVLDLSGDVQEREPYSRGEYQENVPRGNAAGDAGALAFGALLSSGWSALHDLRLSANSIGDAGGAALARALAHNAHLQTLLLDHNHAIAAETVQALCQALPVNATLKTLDISYLATAGARQLALLVVVDALQHNSTRTRFQARNRDTYSGDAGRWHAALRQHPSLRFSQLRFCTRRGPDSGGSRSFTDEGTGYQDDGVDSDGYYS
jgi:hypothetical protein